MPMYVLECIGCIALYWNIFTMCGRNRERLLPAYALLKDVREEAELERWRRNSIAIIISLK